MKTLGWFKLLFGLGLLLLSSGRLSAAFYNTQVYQGNGLGAPVGNGSLQMSNSTSTINARFSKGAGTFTDNLVIYIDSVPGGITTTELLSNKANAMEIAISGYNTSRSVANFAPGFGADYAIVLGIGNAYPWLYRIVENAGAPYIEQVRWLPHSAMDNGSFSSYDFAFNWTEIGLTAGATNFFKFESTYIMANGVRNLQSFEGLTGSSSAITFTNYDTYGVQPIPENTSAALAIFGGIVISVVVIQRVRHPS